MTTLNPPKRSGYRGVHDIYSYNVNSEYGESYKGLLIEIQYRILNQHAWATAVEVVGFITENQPKFEQGDGRFLEIFRFASEIMSRAFEDKYSCLSNLSNKAIVEGFYKLDSELSFIQMLEGLNAIDKEIFERRSVILISGEDGLEIKVFSSIPRALTELFRLEEEDP